MQWLAVLTLAFGTEFWTDQMARRLQTTIVRRKYQWADFSTTQCTALVDLVFGYFRATLRPELAHVATILLQLLVLIILHRTTVIKYETFNYLKNQPFFD